ncbi:MAG: 2-hydroxyacid dehydrogenase [Alphaproteobacteria bacterium]
MRVAIFSTKPYDRTFFERANADHGHRLDFHEAHLAAATVALLDGAEAVCPFVNDRVDAPVLRAMADAGCRLVALRSAGFNNVDLAAARDLGIAVARVPAYSPNAVAEHTLALILSLNRKTHRAYARVREGNFSLDGLLGFDLAGKTAGIVGTGKIGLITARILQGFGCELVAHDPYPSDEGRAAGIVYLPFVDLLHRADIVSFHCPLTPQTRHLLDAAAVSRLKRGAMVINTSRGAIIDARAAIAGLKSGHIGALGLDVYEEEADLFFEDLSGQVLQDDVFARLLTFPNVLITGHQGFFTQEALTAIAETTLDNLTAFERDGAPLHPVTIEKLA